MIKNNLKAKVQKPVLNYKRKVAKKDTFLFDLNEEDLQKIFTAFYSAVKSYNEVIVYFPPESRGRGFEASMLNTCLMKEIQIQFPKNWKFWKYKRFVLSLNGYSFLFKKLNTKGMPMNIKTRANESIMNQMQTLLFDPSDYENPIIFFGFKKANSGKLINPHFVYIDEGQVKWRLYQEEIDSVIPMIEIPASNERLKPRVKEAIKKKKAM